MRIMYDVVDAGAAPTDGDLYAGYIDGAYRSYDALVGRFPDRIHVAIAVFASTDAGQVLDVEQGDATPAQAPGWALRARARGQEPTIYCSASVWPDVRAAFGAQGVAEPHYWIAHYDDDPTMPAGAVAKQYQSTPGWDRSSVADYWPGIDAAPTTPEEDWHMSLGRDDADRARAQAREWCARYLGKPFVGRDPSSTTELETWANQIINDGLDAVLTEFVDSDEHRERAAAEAALLQKAAAS
ncbi:MAG: glycoside hydrolase family 25 domain-containing protein [Acidimicrobiales bacterium]